MTPETARGPRAPKTGRVDGPLLFVAMLVLPLPGFGREAHVLLGVFVWTAVY